MQKNISVIVVLDDEKPEVLEKVIWSYNTQTFRNFEVILVNQNTSNYGLQIIENLRNDVFFPINLVRINDMKLENANINFAINLATTNYILVTKANCLARTDFIEQHIKNRAEGLFLVGSSIEIFKESLENLTKDFIYSSKCFESIWLKRAGVTSIWKRFKITYNGLLTSFLDIISKHNSKLPIENVSFWKSDFDKISIFDDKLIFRLNSIGLISKNIKFRAILLKLTNSNRS